MDESFVVLFEGLSPCLSCVGEIGIPTEWVNRMLGSLGVVGLELEFTEGKGFFVGDHQVDLDCVSVSSKEASGPVESVHHL